MDIKKTVYIVLGCIFFSVGILGYYMPVLPGTIFLIISAYFFMHSSDRLYNKIVNHPVYGNPIKQYVENNVIPFKTKVIILLSMWVATLLTVCITPSMHLPLKIDALSLDFIINFKVVGVVLAVIGTVVVLRARNSIESSLSEFKNNE